MSTEEHEVQTQEVPENVQLTQEQIKTQTFRATVTRNGKTMNLGIVAYHSQNKLINSIMQRYIQGKLFFYKRLLKKWQLS